MASIPSTPKLYIQQIQDLYTRTNFQNLQSYFLAQNQLYGFGFFEINETAAVTNKTIAHQLGFAPKDIVCTLIIGAGTLTWNWGLFTATNLNYSTTGAVRVRFFVGTYFNDSSVVSFGSKDSQTISSTG